MATAEGWLYLACVLDLASRRIVGWSMSGRMQAALVCDALKMAYWRRKPAAGLIVHSDRGSQYASDHYQRLLGRHGITCSMSRRGDCWDNAVVESFFASLKVERLHEQRYATVEQLRTDVADYIERFYNRQRRHSTLGYLSPAIYELRHAA